MLIVDDSREKKPNKRPTELQRTRLPFTLTNSDVIPEVVPISFPTSPQCHSMRHLQCHSRRHPHAIPNVTPNVIPNIPSNVIPDVCNRESSQLKKRKPWIPANYQRE